MSYVRKLGASALVIAAAFAVAFAVLVSSTSTQTAEAADVTLPNVNNSATAAPGDTVQITVAGEFARVSITETADGVGGSFEHNDGQSIACADNGSCDADDTDNGAVQVDLKIDADAGEGYILLSVGGLGATTATKVINVSKATLVGSLTIKAVSSTIAANDADTTAGDAGVNRTAITVNVKNAASTPTGLNTRSVTLITTLGSISCDGGSAYSQACSVSTAASSSTPGVEDGEDGWATVYLLGAGVEGEATVTATLGNHTDTVDVTLYGEAKNLTAEPEQGSVEIGGSVFIVLTVTDAAGNPVSGATVIAGTPKEVVGPEGVDNPVLVVTEKDTPTRDDFTDDVLGVGYSKDKAADKAADRIPACGQDNSDTDGDTSGLQELFETEGTNDKGQCVVYVTAPENSSDATKNATRGEHTLNFQVTAAIKASATIEVAGKPSSITTDAPAVIDPASVTAITVSVWDDEDVLVGITEVKVRKVGGDGLIEDEGEGGSERTVDGQSKFTFIAPSAVGSSEILITAGDAETRLTLQIGEPEPEPVPEPEAEPALSTTPSSTGATLVTFNGGSVDELSTVLTDACGDGGRAYATDYQGNWVAFIPSAPAVVNAPFNALFSDGIADGTPLLISNCGG